MIAVGSNVFVLLYFIPNGEASVHTVSVASEIRRLRAHDSP